MKPLLSLPSAAHNDLAGLPGMRRLGRTPPLAVVLLALVLLAVLAGGALAASGQLQRSAVLAGGGGRLESGAIVLQAAVGQSISGSVAQGSQQLCSGILCGWQEQLDTLSKRVYLPVMHK